MQTNIALAGTTVVAGLSWSSVPRKGPGRKKEIRSACMRSGLTHGVIVDGYGDQAALGLCAKSAEYPSGAAMLAAANAQAMKSRGFGSADPEESWILIEKIKSGDGAGMYWMCGIAEGAPIAGGDTIEDLAVTTAKLADFVEVLTNVQIFSTDQDMLDYVAGASPTFMKGFAELTAGMVVPKALKPKKLVGIPNSAYAGIVGALLLAVCVMGVSWWSDQRAAEVKRKADAVQKERLAKERRDAELKESQTYQEAEAAARKAELDHISSALSRDPVVVMAAWSKALDGIPLNHGGWSITGASCDMKACVVSLARDESSGTNASLREMIPDAEIGESGVASYSIPLDLRATRSIALEALPYWSSFEVGAASALQQLNMGGVVSATIGPRKEIMYLPPALPAAGGPGAEPAAPPQQKPLGYQSGALSIAGTNLWQIDSLADYLQSGEFVATSLSVGFGADLSADPTWKVSGEYFLRSTGAAAPPPGSPAGQAPGMIPNGSGPNPPANQPLPSVAAQPLR